MKTLSQQQIQVEYELTAGVASRFSLKNLTNKEAAEAAASSRTMWSGSQLGQE
jgi:hypothetical protein